MWLGRNKIPIKNIEDWKKFEGYNQAVAFNVFNEKEMQICPTCNKKYNSTCEKQIVLLMIPNVEKEGWHHLAVKNICIITWSNVKR